MRHAATKSLYEYWCELLPETAAGEVPLWPDRSEIEPAAMRLWLGDVFVLQQRDGEARYRLAGTRICSLYGAELAGTPFVRAFDGADRNAAKSWLGTFGQNATPLLFSSRAFADNGASVVLETLVLPLRHAAEQGDERALGITTPAERPAWLGLSPIVREEIASVRVVRPWETGISKRDWPVMRPAAHGRMERLDRRTERSGRRVAHLVVLQGGLT